MVAWRVTCVRATVDVATGAGFVAVTLAFRTVRTARVVVVVDAEASGVTVALGSGATGVASVTGGAASVAGAGWVSVVTGWVAWANKGVEESARAAAIAGRALVRA